VRLRAALLLLALVACGDSSDGGDQSSGNEHAHDHPPAAKFTEEEADTRAEVSLKDFEFVGLPPTLKGPKVYLTLVNVGAVQHEMMVIGPDGKPVAAASPFPTGNNKTLAAELPPGSYMVECRIKEGDKTHAELGMRTALTVT
jgi:hypothetical protein